MEVNWLIAEMIFVYINTQKVSHKKQEDMGRDSHRKAHAAARCAREPRQLIFTWLVFTVYYSSIHRYLAGTSR